MTVSICLLYTVTLCFPGSYHQEICESTPKHHNVHTNLTLVPSYSINTTTCTYIFNNQPSSHHLGKSIGLSGRPPFTTLPIYDTHSHHNLQKTQSWNSSLSKTRTPLTQYIYTPTPASVIHSNSPLLSTSTELGKDQDKWMLVCSPQPTASNVKTNSSTKNQSTTSSSEDEMPSVVKYVTVFSLMAFAGGYSSGYGPSENLV